MICIKLRHHVKDVGSLNLGPPKISDLRSSLITIFTLAAITCPAELHLLGEDEHEHVIGLSFRCTILRSCRVFEFVNHMIRKHKKIKKYRTICKNRQKTYKSRKWVSNMYIHFFQLASYIFEAGSKVS